MALLFAVASFWWLNARQGKLQSYEPHSFAFSGGSHVLLFRLPLVLYNTGAKPIIVQNLQLAFPDEPSAVLPLPWRSERAQLGPEPEDGHRYPAVFSVPGRQAQQHFMEFGGPFPSIDLAARDYKVVLQARLGHKRGWRNVLTFTLRAAHITHPYNYVTYSNSPFDITPEMAASAQRSLATLMRTLGEGAD